ncbi:hypothetical protein [Roseateles violae]|uniref:Uncharacterized protein n=1 Tax=Roseateles violae TaxID=3058042 RepID=A0ABT8DU84_9BURK|nr:hypothetical protein [Pelomonas sp. PFR6]MDN3921866.1 hypothetical protein [Pelomonas sp. PFR6]
MRHRWITGALLGWAGTASAQVVAASAAAASAAGSAPITWARLSDMPALPLLVLGVALLLLLAAILLTWRSYRLAQESGFWLRSHWGGLSGESGGWSLAPACMPLIGALVALFAGLLLLLQLLSLQPGLETAKLVATPIKAAASAASAP